MFRPMLHGQNRNSTKGRNPSFYDPSFWIDHHSSNIVESVNYVETYKDVDISQSTYHVYDSSDLSTYERPFLMGAMTGFNGNQVASYYGYDPTSPKYFGVNVNWKNNDIIEDPASPLKRNLTSFFAIGLAWQKNRKDYGEPSSIHQLHLSPNFGNDNLSVCIDVDWDYTNETGFNYKSIIKVILSNQTTSSSKIIGEWEESLGSFEDEQPALELAKVYVLAFDMYRLFVNGVQVLDWSSEVSDKQAYAPYSIFKDINPAPYYGLMSYNHTCYVGEVLMYGRALLTSEFSDVNKWLMLKYGIEQGS